MTICNSKFKHLDETLTLSYWLQYVAFGHEAISTLGLSYTDIEWLPLTSLSLFSFTLPSRIFFSSLVLCS